MKKLMNKLSLSLIRAKLGFEKTLKEERGDTNFISIAIVLILVIIIAVIVYGIWTGIIKPALDRQTGELTSILNP